MKVELLDQAGALIRHHRFGEAIRILEPEIIRYHDSFHYYYLLAIACIQSGDTGGALTYFHRARDIRTTDANTIIGLAYLYMQKGDTEKAVKYYLDVLEKEPKNRKALKGLEMIRRFQDSETLAIWLNGKKKAALIPKIPRGSITIYICIAAISTSLLIGSIVILFFFKHRQSIYGNRPKIANSALTSDEIKSPVTLGGIYDYLLTEHEVIELYVQAQEYFLQYRDEAARVILNKLMGSNASADIKAKINILMNHTVVPTFSSLKDRFSYSDVLQNPNLYKSCHVIWQGMATNLYEGDSKTQFDLLVGYDKKHHLDGIVPVLFNIAIAIDINRPMEILGRINTLQTTDGSIKFTVDGIAIHQSMPIN